MDNSVKDVLGMCFLNRLKQLKLMSLFTGMFSFLGWFSKESTSIKCLQGAISGTAFGCKVNPWRGVFL
jgi:hypothetical protein